MIIDINKLTVNTDIPYTKKNESSSNNIIVDFTPTNEHIGNKSIGFNYEEVNISKNISIKQPITPQECDYYFETREDFDARRDQIIAENNNDLSQKTFGFGDGVTDLNNAFKMTDITSAPKMIVARNITYFRECFASCSSLTTIPSGLFDNCPNVTNFSGCFSDCTSLTTIPSGLFDNCINVTDFYFCFYGCALIISALPDVWNKDKFPKVTNGKYYAVGCTKAANYNEIPAEFGGPNA